MLRIRGLTQDKKGQWCNLSTIEHGGRAGFHVVQVGWLMVKGMTQGVVVMSAGLENEDKARPLLTC